MEHFTLNTIVDYARQNGYMYIIGEYLPTTKNGIVKEHYPNLGFSPIEGVETSQWILNVEKYQDIGCYITAK